MRPPVEHSLKADWMAGPRSVDLSALAPWSRTLQVLVVALVLRDVKGPTLPESWAVARGTMAVRRRVMKCILPEEFK